MIYSKQTLKRIFSQNIWIIQTYVNVIRIRSPTLCHSLTEQNNMNNEVSSPIASVVSICHFIVNKRISDSQELVGIWPLLNSLPFSPCRNILHRSCPRCPGTCGRFWPLRCAELSPLSPPPDYSKFLADYPLAQNLLTLNMLLGGKSTSQGKGARPLVALSMSRPWNVRGCKWVTRLVRVTLWGPHTQFVSLFSAKVWSS